jgi:hypothetical protein
MLHLVDKILAAELPSDGFHYDPDIGPGEFRYDLPLRIIHKYDEFYFDLRCESNDYGNEYFVVTRFPGGGPFEKDLYPDKWTDVVDCFGEWLGNLKTELSQPDPWAVLKQSSTLADQVPLELVGIAFDEEELQGLHSYLTSVREYLFSEVEPTEAQSQAIDERLTYLGRTALRLSKQDWAHIADGASFRIAMGMSLNRERREKLSAMTSDFINTLFRRLLN